MHSIGTLKNLFIISFGLLGAGIVMRYNTENVISILQYIGLYNTLGLNVNDGLKLIQVYASIQILVFGFLVAFFGFKINKISNS
jgi:hypothetical protein